MHLRSGKIVFGKEIKNTNMESSEQNAQRFQETMDSDTEIYMENISPTASAAQNVATEKTVCSLPSSMVEMSHLVAAIQAIQATMQANMQDLKQSLNHKLDTNNENIKKINQAFIQIEKKIDKNQQTLRNEMRDITKGLEEKMRKLEKERERDKKENEIELIRTKREMETNVGDKIREGKIALKSELKLEMNQWCESEKEEIVQEINTEFELIKMKLAGEVEKRITDERQEINYEINTKVVEVKERVKAVEKKMINIGNCTTTCRSNTTGDEKKLPNFDGNIQKMHPMEFIEVLEKHFRNKTISELEKIEIVIEQLEGDVEIWAKSEPGRWITFDDFRRDFLNYYWSECTQKRILEGLFRPKAYNARYGSMQHHVWTWVNKTRYLTLSISRASLIDSLIKHFPNDVQNILMGARVETTEQLTRLLGGIEEKEKGSRREDERNQNPRNVHVINEGWRSPSVRGNRGRGMPRGRGYRPRQLSPNEGNEN